MTTNIGSINGLFTATGLNAGSAKITNVATPTISTDGVNKSYADGLNPLLPTNTELVFVAKGGSDSTGLGTQALPYLTITHAIASISDNSVTKPYAVMIMGGIFQENFDIKSNVSIIGSGVG